MSTTEDFLHVNDHYAKLVARLSPEDLTIYNSTKHVRVETGFRGRQFTIYRMGVQGPEILDRILVEDFVCDDEGGATTRMLSLSMQRSLMVGYAPVKLWEFPVFVCLPLHSKVRWGAPESNIDAGSLGFPIVIRTLSRLNLKERGVVYCETGPSFASEFEPLTTN